jgi:hypothetical protein
VLTLFDEERGFANLLTEGKGTATVVSNASFSGAVCLHITPPQRFETRIPGWSYPIVEKPGAGEYRYLRFAWRSATASGIMLELASGGLWPPPDKSTFRYYCGENSTGWRARKVNDHVPAEWTVVTVDLWQDCGAFKLTGIAPTAMGGPVFFDRIQLLRTLE